MDTKICAGLQSVWHSISWRPIDEFVTKYEEIVHETIQESCGVQEPKEHDHRRRSKPDRPSRFEKKLLKRKCMLRKTIRAQKRESELSESQIKQAKREYGYVLSSIKRSKEKGVAPRPMKTAH